MELMGMLQPNNANASTCATLGLALLIPGLLGPFMAVETMGQVERYSIFDLISRLSEEKQWTLLSIVVLFSTLFPLSKLIFMVILSTTIFPLSDRICRILYLITEKTARFSMVDVMVVALMVVALKVDGFASVDIGWGTLCFFGSVLFSLLAGLLLDVTRFNPMLQTAKSIDA